MYGVSSTPGVGGVITSLSDLRTIVPSDEDEDNGFLEIR